MKKSRKAIVNEPQISVYNLYHFNKWKIWWKEKNIKIGEKQNQDQPTKQAKQRNPRQTNKKAAKVLFICNVNTNYSWLRAVPFFCCSEGVHASYRTLWLII